MPDPVQVDADVYKSGRLAARLQRRGEEVTFRYLDSYRREDGPPVATSLPVVTSRVIERDGRLPSFFAGLLPEGRSRREHLERALHLAPDDELGLLARIGADTIGDVQVVAHDEALPNDPSPIELPDFAQLRVRQLFAGAPEAGVVLDRTSLPGVQPKLSSGSRSVTGGPLAEVIVKLALPGWRGVLTNEWHFLRAARSIGLSAPRAEVVTDAAGIEALAVARFDRRRDGEGRLVRIAQEDASQVLGLRPAEKYDPEARAVIEALASQCGAPRLAARDLLRQMLFSYVIGNNDAHAKNFSIQARADTSEWTVTPVYDVLHTGPYEGDHRFVPAVHPDGPKDAVSRRWWLELATQVGLPEQLANKLVDGVVAAVPAILDGIEQSGLDDRALRDLRRVIRRRARDLAGGPR